MKTTTAHQHPRNKFPARPRRRERERGRGRTKGKPGPVHEAGAVKVAGQKLLPLLLLLLY